MLRRTLLKLRHCRQVNRKGILIGHKVQKNQNSSTCSFRYLHIANPLRKTIARNWHIIELIPGCKQKLTTGYSRGRSLNEILSRAGLSMEGYTTRKTEVLGHSKCGRCSVSPMALEIKEFMVPVMTETIKFK